MPKPIKTAAGEFHSVAPFPSTSSIAWKYCWCQTMTTPRKMKATANLMRYLSCYSIAPKCLAAQFDVVFPDFAEFVFDIFNQKFQSGRKRVPVTLV